MEVLRIHHVQLAMPAAREWDARVFYGELLGIPERQKPESLAQKGGVWFEAGALKIHLGIEDDFRPAKKAHPCLEVSDIAAMAVRLEEAGIEVERGVTAEGIDRFYADDPFGNRIEFVGISR